MAIDVVDLPRTFGVGAGLDADLAHGRSQNLAEVPVSMQPSALLAGSPYGAITR